MPHYNHAYDFAFEVLSDHPEGEDVTPAMLIAACRARLDRIEATDDGAEMRDACDRFDTYEEIDAKTMGALNTVLPSDAAWLRATRNRD